MSDTHEQPRGANRSEDAASPRSAPGVVDEWVAWNVRIQREKLRMSQADLAQKMAALGWKYHPQTVHRIESGQRKVTVGEAEALARIFSTTVDSLTWPDMAIHTAAWLSVFTDRADAAFAQISDQTCELLFDREHLERALAEVGRRGISEQVGGDPALEGAIDEARSVLENATPEKALEVGEGQYAEWRTDASDSTWNVVSGDNFPNRLPRAPWLEVLDGGGKGESDGLRS